MTMRRLRGAMYSTRMRSFPPIPGSLRELTSLLLRRRIRERVAATFDEEDNMYAGSCTARDGSHHVLFFSQRMLRFMSNVKIIQGDGTFRARPSIPKSSQCFVLVTPWRDAVVILGWILMEKRNLSAYKAISNCLKRLCPNLNPEVIISDWEYPQQRAWQQVFPNAKIQGCLWHLCRAFIKKANPLHILRFKNVLPLMKFIKKTCAISLLPKRFFLVGLRVVKDGAREADIAISYLLRPFFEYVEQKWIRNANRRNWMKFYNCLYRTNNNMCESLNKMLRSKVGAYRPNIWIFIIALAHLEHNTNLDIDFMSGGGTCRRARHWRSVYTDTQIRALSEDLEMDVFHNMDEAVHNFLERAIDVFSYAFDAHVPNEMNQNG